MTRIVYGVLVPAALAAILVSAVDLPRSSVEGALLVTALLLPLALAWAMAATLSSPFAGRIAESPRWLARVLVAGHVGGVLLALGAFATDLTMRDWPFGPRSCLMLTATVLVAFAGVWQSRRLFAPAARLVAGGQVLPLAGALLVVDGLGLALFDEHGISTEVYLHARLVHVGVALLSVGLAWLLGRRRLPSLALGAGLMATLALVVALAPRDRRPLYDRVARTHGMHARILAMARGLADRDGDGFSARFGGGDCDDRDPAAFPLSTVRDCLGWRVGPAQKTPYLPEIDRKPEAPRLILLITIDAFRCGFGGDDQPALLRDACPNLTRLAKEGWARLDAHTSATNTSAAMTALMTGNANADPLMGRHRKRPTLAQRLRQAGYRTEVMMTFHNIVDDQATRESFDEVNTELRTEPQSVFRGEDLTALTLAHARAALAEGQRAFLWAHYPDPHFPYTLDREPWKRWSLPDYARVVERTDAAVGALIDAVARLPGAADVLIVVTADHGEEFARDHGERFHGFTLYEPVVRVPIIAWSPAQHRRFSSAPPPSSTARLAQYVLDAAGEPLEPEAPPSDDVLLRTVMLDRQFGVISNGWKLIYNASRNTTELFDLRRDPSERHNLAQLEPNKVQALGHILGGMLAPRVWGRTGR